MTEAGLPLEIERKYLIRRPDAAFLRSLPDCTATQITQTYLTYEGDGFGRRVRRRGRDGDWQYTYTRKQRIGAGTHIELEDEITAEQYSRLLTQADPERHTIEKTRWCIPCGGYVLELDTYAFSEELATLEIELPDIHTPVQLPGWVEVIADVTEERGYSNYALSAALAFPPRS